MFYWENYIREKRIIFFVAETIPSFAGGGRNAFNFARFLASYGAKTHVISLNYNNILPKKQVIEKVLIQRLAYYNRNALTKGFSILFLVYKYFSLIKSQDIIFIYGRYLPGYLSIIISSLVMHKQVIFRSSLLNDDDILAIKKHSTVFWPIYKYAFSHINLYFAINKSFEEKWKNIFYDLVPIFCHVQGVDNNIFNCALRKLHYKKISDVPITILSCGIVVERKGYKQIFKSLLHLDIPFKYIVIGQYLPDKYHRSSSKEKLEMKSLYKLGKELLGDKIEFINSTNNIINYYIESDIFLHFASEEGTPNVLIEAMAIGMPIITRQFDGIEIIKHNDNVEIVSSDEEIVHAIKKLTINPDYCNRISNNAALTLARGHTFKHIAEKLFLKLNND